MADAAMIDRLMGQLRQLIAAVFLVLGLALIFYFLALFAWQIYRWLDSGVWNALPASLAFANLSEMHAMAQASADIAVQKNFAVLAYLPEVHRTDWMDDPKRWVGIHKMMMWALEFFSIGFVSLVLGIVSIAIGGNVSEAKRPGGQPL